MHRKKALALAISVAGLVAASSVAVAMNLGIVAGTTESSPDGSASTIEEAAARLAPSTPMPSDADDFSPFPDGTEVVTVMVDDPEPGSAGEPTAPASVSARRAPAGIAFATPAPAEAGADTDAVTYPVFGAGDAGEVAIEQSVSGLTFWGAYPADASWSYGVEHEAGREVQVIFTNGTRRIRFTAELEDGAINVRVRELTADGSPGPAAVPAEAAPTTEPLRGHDDDEHDNDDFEDFDDFEDNEDDGHDGPDAQDNSEDEDD